MRNHLQFCTTGPRVASLVTAPFRLVVQTGGVEGLARLTNNAHDSRYWWSLSQTENHDNLIVEYSTAATHSISIIFFHFSPSSFPLSGPQLQVPPRRAASTGPARPLQVVHHWHCTGAHNRGASTPTGADQQRQSVECGRAQPSAVAVAVE
ncbi:hypothetical protein CLAFUW4_00584 [Fulvia fulva]|uniref:Uncharacterized protein n=1 Tax=Passalora fulva TaxID=5499 RepID=A0A9Q8L7F1_PASFU|nr:uncharacterized protein CLAFUR5_00583 [Fulvia fulva]KAK4634115.1 hypothetical protein CLAFUR4_00585 [Fulvia fulva]KAK4637993.1 hypothetical protein CLAFUR0_00586 [Fulvia fulva]UJO12275.1 hypothetical protein CLAFUR5_00583 [Fulvia fulva]WPV09387.1 hypothetical protein CLAFUW4_00584 [Fulvia fulva]WPV24612.1 hypothetical protein CLAFUW7_00589 [Fulvia fulva]